MKRKRKSQRSAREVSINHWYLEKMETLNINKEKKKNKMIKIDVE